MPTVDDQPLVTVIIPAYNAARFLPSTLRSAAAQTHANLQILIVDDGSHDATADIVTAFAASDPRIELMTKANGGLAAARSDGIGNARGEYVAFLDADDLWHPAKIEMQLQALREYSEPGEVGAVYTLSRQIDEEDCLVADYPPLAIEGSVLCRHLLYNFVATGGSNLLCPRHVATAVGGFDIGYQPADAGTSEDYDFQLKLAAHYDFVVVDQYLVGYRRHAGSMSRNRLRMARSRRSVIERHLARNRVSDRCRRWALGAVDVVECGAFLAARRPIAAIASVLRLALNDPRRLIEEIFVRLPSALVSHLRRQGDSTKTPPVFQTLDPSVAKPAQPSGLLMTRLAALAKEDAERVRERQAR